jgi:hypothetical protein
MILLANLCLRCNNPFGPNLAECPNCSLPNFYVMPWISEEIKQEYLSQRTDKKTEINQKMIERIFKMILDKYNVKPIRLKVKEGKTGLFEILSLNDAHSNIEVTYNPVTLSFYDHEEIESMLYHEAFHLSQGGSSGILVRDFNSPELTDYISDFTVVYYELVNYKSQHQYYEISQPFSRVKRKEISNYSVILSNLKHLISSNNLPTPLFPHQTVLKILSDAVYFRLIDQQSFASWAEKNHSNALLTYYDWITEDFSMIYNSNPSRDDVFKSTQLVGMLTISVDTTETILGDRIEFSPDAFNMYRRHHDLEDNRNNMARHTITQSWIDRYNSTYLK